MGGPDCWAEKRVFSPGWRERTEGHSDSVLRMRVGCVLELYDSVIPHHMQGNVLEGTLGVQ